MHWRKQPPQPLKTMTNQELTLDQLQTIVGGIIHPDFIRNIRRVATKGFIVGPIGTRGIRGEKDQPLKPWDFDVDIDA
ncbi:CCRG-2 family RiPP [Prochlorococcus marinus]|uniref:CCRG-2 family RiPP n=2 Tax=Prochlorococcus TaxID=1218 RepID=UPI0007B3A211|nr:CCRG-2 family RiPP [Prochlorococcus marinus]